MDGLSDTAHKAAMASISDEEKDAAALANAPERMVVDESHDKDILKAAAEERERSMAVDRESREKAILDMHLAVGDQEAHDKAKDEFEASRKADEKEVKGEAKAAKSEVKPK